MSKRTLASADGIFEIEQENDTIIVIPAVDLRELEYHRIEQGARIVFAFLNEPGIKNVVLDFHKTDYYGSTALGLFVRAWKKVKERNGRMAFCNVSPYEKEILQITHLDRLWPICSSRIEALKAIRE